MKNAFICSICEGFIFDGETMWSVNVHHEVSENCVIIVLDAKPEDTFPENYLDKIKPAESDIMFPPRIP